VLDEPIHHADISAAGGLYGQALHHTYGRGSGALL